MSQDEETPWGPRSRPLQDSRLLTPGRSIAGVDGCKKGWVMVRRDEQGRFDSPVVRKCLDELPWTDVVLIDIPIGLPDSGRRDCDLAARSMLGPRRNAVFTGARRPLLSMSDYKSANAWGKKQNNLGVSMQMWAILPKVREVDAWIARERNRTIREGHPELSFCAAAGRPMAHYKKDKKGQGQRLNVLASFVDKAMVLRWLDQTRGAAKDDVLDALALCWSAARLALSCHRILPSDHPPQDSRGLPMEMVF